MHTIDTDQSRIALLLFAQSLEIDFKINTKNKTRMPYAFFLILNTIYCTFCDRKLRESSLYRI